MEQTDFLLTFFEVNILKFLDTKNTEFIFEESKFFKLGKKIDKSSSEIIENLKLELNNKILHFSTKYKNKHDEPISFIIKYEPFRGEFEIILLPTKSEIENLVLRENLRQEFFEKEISKRIMQLSSYESVILIDDVLRHDDLLCINNFKLNPKASDDEGIDFFATLCIDRNKKIDFEGYGKDQEILGQLKHYQTKVPPSEIRDFIGVLKSKKKKFGMFIGSSGFTDRAFDAVKESNFTIFCEDISFISKLIIKHKIGLNKANSKLGYFIDEEWWDEIKHSS